MNITKNFGPAFIAKYGEKALQLRFECKGSISDPSLSESQCQRVEKIESIVNDLGGEVACFVEAKRMQLDMVLPMTNS